MKYILSLILLLQVHFLTAQLKHLEEFYPQNVLYKKLKVRMVLDSTDRTKPGEATTQVYDTLGRQLGVFYLGKHRQFVPWEYRSSGDTLWRLKYVNDTSIKKLYSYEQFIYSKTKKILRYTICTNSYTFDGKFYAGINTFRYDNNDQLTSQIEHNSYNYSEPIAENMTIDENKLNFDDVINYYYKTSGKNYLIIAKHILGKPDMRVTDTFYYNDNKLVRTASFAGFGYSGELGRNNLNNISEYQYTKNSVTQLVYETWCLAVDKTIGCLSPQQSETDNYVKVYQPNGLPLEHYSLHTDGSKYYLSKYYYTYY
jgi:hypothetical protein